MCILSKTVNLLSGVAQQAAQHAHNMHLHCCGLCAIVSRHNCLNRWSDKHDEWLTRYKGFFKPLHLRTLTTKHSKKWLDGTAELERQRVAKLAKQAAAAVAAEAAANDAAIGAAVAAAVAGTGAATATGDAATALQTAATAAAALNAKSKRKRSEAETAVAALVELDDSSSGVMAPCNGSEERQAKRATTTAAVALSPLVTMPAALSASNSSANCFSAAVNGSPASAPLKLLAAQCAAHDEKEQQQQQQQQQQQHHL
jgi:hypothetical protein